MTLILLSLLTLIILAFLFSPILFKSSPLSDRNEHEIAVLSNILKEIEIEKERGIITPAEAESAKIEVSRKLLKIQRYLSTDSKSTNNRPYSGIANKKQLHIAIFSGLLVLIISFSLYLPLGNYQYDDMPYHKRFPQSAISEKMNELISVVEERLRENPKDAEGWSAIAPAYMKLKRYQEAFAAYTNLLRLKKHDASTLNGYGEASFYLNQGQITDKALRAFEASFKIDDKNMVTNYYLGLGKMQRNLPDQTVIYWKKIIDHASEGADKKWLGEMAKKIERIETMLGAGEFPKNTK